MVVDKNYCFVHSANASPSQRGQSKEDGRIFSYSKVVPLSEIIAWETCEKKVKKGSRK